MIPQAVGPARSFRAALVKFAELAAAGEWEQAEKQATIAWLSAHLDPSVLLEELKEERR